jgi:23S rRNA (pseudouridine1915-N3)-methyltransferase
MQITLIAIGKTQSSWLQEGNAEYGKRLQHYGRFQFIETPDIKPRSGRPDPQWVMQEEAKLLDKHLKGVDHLVLLDENGKSYSSVAFSKHIEKLQVRGLRHVAWVIGGPYGFAPRIRDLAQEHWSLGPMTFSHQMIRPFALEQLYRAHTILKGEPYHHQ